MGCDIHIIAEVKENYTLLGELKFQSDRLFQLFKSLFMDVQIPQRKWKVNTDRIFPNPWYEKDNPSDWQKHEFNSIPDDNRNYDWFSILANVRNGYGFAGVETGQGFKVIAKPRGVPEDATTEWKETVERWGCDMHSTSYLYLQDFDSFDWNQVTMKTGVVTLEQYQKLRGTNEVPDIYCGGVGGQKTVTITQDEADIHLISPQGYLEDKTIYVQYYWPVVYREWFDYKIKNVVEPLRKLKKKYTDVRIVFGFDN